MITKERLLQTLEDMPEKISVEELIDRILLIQKIENGIEDAESGRTYTTEEAKEKLGKWLK